MTIEDMPISNVTWIEVDKLKANDYNPNYVQKPEMELLKFSILKQGWIQPILVTQDFTIIDGFHRASIAKADKDVSKMTNGKVPVVIMQMSEPERMLLTIRINRAKGNHAAIKMADIIHKLVNDYGIPLGKIGEEIGAGKDEIDLLLLDDIFKKYKIDENSKYSKAWVPSKK